MQGKSKNDSTVLLSVKKRPAGNPVSPKTSTEKKHLDSPNFLVEDVDAQEGHWFLSLLRRSFQPDFLVSFNLHILALIAAAVFLLPIQTERSLSIEGDYSLDPIEFDRVEVAVEFSEPEIELETELVDFVEEQMPEETQATLADNMDFSDADFSNSPDYESLTSDGVIELGSESRIGQGSELQQATLAIQEKVIKAGGMSGEVQFSLVWKTESDLDLHVINPRGDRIFYDSRIGNWRGELDVDRNADSRRLTKEPVENVRWLEGQPVSGRYTVWVHLFRARNENSTEFEMMAKTGDDVDIKEAEVSLSNGLLVYRYYYFGDDVPMSEREKRLEELKQLQDREEKAATKLMGKVRGGGAQSRHQLLAIAANYPHTDAAIEALKRVEGESRK